MSTHHRPAFISSVIYEDNRAAIAWLERAFGFEPSLVLINAEEKVVHAEMTHDDGVIMVGPEWAAWAKSPASIGGGNTQVVNVRLARGIDQHCERARAAGATIVQEPADQFYGDRIYMAVDCEGHHWSFAQPVREVSRAEMAKVSGLKVRTRP